MKIPRMQTTFLLCVLWIFCVVDVSSRRNSKGLRRRGRAKDRAPFDGLSLKGSKKVKLSGDTDSEKLPFEKFSRKPRFQPARPMLPGGTGSEGPSLSLLFPGPIRPSSDETGHFVVSRRNHIKKEWCKTKRIKQVVTEKGCISRSIMNKYCYGQCNSFYIPGPNSRTLKDPSAFVSCGFCKPLVHSTIRVTLLCPGKKFTRHKRKRVLKVKKCSCMAQNVDVSYM